MPRIIGLALLVGLVGCREAEAPSGAGSSSGGDESESTAPATVGLGAQCVPDERRSCYGGPLGSEGLGVCRAGEQVCAADGTEWLPCADEVLPAAREDCSTAQDDDCDGSVVCEPELVWTKQTQASFRHLALDGQGHTYVGSSGGAFEYEGVVLDDVYLLKVDEQGDLLWHHSFIHPGVDWVADLAVDAEQRSTMVGYYTLDFDAGGGMLPYADERRGFVARYDGDGNHLWSRGTTFTSVSAVDVGPDGSVYVAGRRDLLDESLVVVAFTSDGIPAWERRLSGVFGLSDRAIAVAVLDSGEVVVGAIFSPSQSVEPTLDGEPVDLGLYGAYALRLSAGGTLIDERPLHTELTVPLDNLELFGLEDGTLLAVFTAHLEGFNSGVLAHFTDELEPVSEQWLGTEATVRGVDVGPDDTVVLALEFYGALDVSPIGVHVPPNVETVGLLGIDRQGQGRWLELLRDPASVWVHGLAVGPDGSVVARISSGTSVEVGGQAIEGATLSRFRP
ncbi:MAG: hypothetical protein AAF799_17515 [Myxococcota bacterium]